MSTYTWHIMDDSNGKFFGFVLSLFLFFPMNVFYVLTKVGS